MPIPPFGSPPTPDATSSVKGKIQLAGDLTGSAASPALAAAGPGATGPIGDATHSSAVTIDAKGRVTALSSIAITGVTPSAHATSHKSGGSDAIKLDELAATTDVTTLNASTSAHGLLPKLDNTATHFLDGTGAWSAPAAPGMARSARSSNTILAAADKGQVICATAAYTQTFTASATLGAGWWCIVKNDTSDGTTVLTLDPNASETIDALTTTKMYSGETRLIECDGSNFFSQMLEGGFAKFVPSGLGTFVVPAGISLCDVVCIGSGGQGGGGFSGTGSGGAGGGGGASTRAAFRPGDLGAAGASITVTAAAGGTGAGTAGSDGANGATTTFGTLLKAAGGGGGQGGQSSAASQGGGGGSTVANAATVTGGAPTNTAANGDQGSSPGAAGANGNNAVWGGASGAGSPFSANTRTGGSAIWGGPGGGAGAPNSATQAAGAGGATQSYVTAGGGGGGSSGASPTPGTDGTFTGPYCGTGGGGGGGSTTGSTNGRNGGVGSIGAGGGGGGAASGASSTGGTGGAGGAGECRVWYS